MLTVGKLKRHTSYFVRGNRAEYAEARFARGESWMNGYSIFSD